MTGPNPNQDSATPVSISTALADLKASIEHIRAHPPANPYPHRLVHDRMAYDWYCWSGAARYEIAGHVKPWLAGACRERGIASSKMTRAQMIDALVAWQVEAEKQAGWAPAGASTPEPGR